MLPSVHQTMFSRPAGCSPLRLITIVYVQNMEGGHSCYGTCVEVQGLLWSRSSLPSLLGLQGPNSDHQICVAGALTCCVP